jgi:hypothetical protein
LLAQPAQLTISVSRFFPKSVIGSHSSVVVSRIWRDYAERLSTDFADCGKLWIATPRNP